ncbi:MAG: UDP-N-acetylmuramoyl-L-alanyl-D-glutamate--2,6-diaminopimelate ligase [Acidobacteria bacterium]|nr:UDP-N-acetylmuramoyl-L-alanyl-D-glutamate--2,6-diaminopimelate ligase [Acidobacteriota bacterium]
MTLQQLIQRVPTARVVGDLKLSITGLEYHSQRVRPGGVFFAIRGLNQDGTEFIPEALSQGAVAVVSESSAESVPSDGSAAATWVQVPDVRRALALASCQFYGDPSRQLKLVGITGTNGKTTTTYLVASVLEAAGWKPGLLGTIDYRLSFDGEGRRATASHTTPESLDLQRWLREIVQIGGRSAVMEVSSHALALERVAGCQFHTALLTNVARDHLDFHGDVESYYAAKEKLFLASEETPPPAFAVLNADDPRYAALRSRTPSRVVSYALESDADVRARKWKVSREGIELVADTPEGSVEVRSLLLGRHNLYNLLAAVAAALTLEVSPEAICQGLLPMRVPGRLEPVEEGQPFSVFVDYAHTVEALRHLIASVREWTNPGRLILVFGCGGDRDRGKRPLMGMAAAECDWVVLTSDNPRSEDPLQILNDVTVGLQKGRANYAIELDRGRAIERALREARAGDTVLLAGKGHENCQIVGEQRLPFDDREVARALLRQLGYGAAERDTNRRSAAV